MSGTVLVVDDQVGARSALAAELEDIGLTVIQASNGLEGWECFCAERPDLVVTDMVMPRSDGLELLSRVRARSEVPVILFTAYGSVETAVSALKSGADEFVSSSDLEIEGLVDLVREVLSRTRAPEPLPELERRIQGGSGQIRRVREQISALAPLRTPVLIRGEPGTGRDTVARALHELGSTAGGAWSQIDATSQDDRGSRIPDSGAL